MYLWRTFLTELQVTNKIKFSPVPAVHGVTLPGHLATKPVSLRLILTASEYFAHFNSYLEILSVTSMQCIL